MRFGSLLDEKRAVLQGVFDQMTKTAMGRSAFFFQLEILLIFDQLQSQPYKLREHWSERFPSEELEMVATALAFFCIEILAANIWALRCSGGLSNVVEYREQSRYLR